MRTGLVWILPELMEMAKDEMKDLHGLSDMEADEVMERINTREPMGVWIKVVVTRLLIGMGYAQRVVSKSLNVDRTTISYYLNRYKSPLNMNVNDATKRIAGRLGWKEDE